MELALPLDDVLLGSLQKHLKGHLDLLAGELHQAIERVSELIPALSRWEDDHLLDKASAADLARHKAMVERLLRFLDFAAIAAEQPSPIARPETAQMLEAARALLRDKLTLWHSPAMERSQAEKILSECFPE